MLPHFTVAYWCVSWRPCRTYFVFPFLLNGEVLVKNVLKAGTTTTTREPGWRSSRAPQPGPMQHRPTALRRCRSSLRRCWWRTLAQGRVVLDLLAVLYVFLRLFYILMYVSDMPRVRSAVWGAAFFVNIAIFFLGYR